MARAGVQRRLLAAFLALLASAMLPAALLLGSAVSDDVHDLMRDGLLHQAALLALDLSEPPGITRDPAALQAWAGARAAATGARVTLIAADGRVTADSEVGANELAQLEGHATRPEVAAALGG